MRHSGDSPGYLKLHTKATQKSLLPVQRLVKIVASWDIKGKKIVKIIFKKNQICKNEKKKFPVGSNILTRPLHQKHHFV